MGARTYWRAPIPPTVAADSTAFTSTSTADVAFAQPTIVPSGLYEIGTRLVLTCSGQYTSTSATPTLGIGFYAGGSAAGVVLASAAALAISASATAWPFIMRYQGVIRSLSTAVPAAGTIVGQGELLFGSSLTAFTFTAIPATAAARTASLYTQGTLQQMALTVGGIWSSATGSPTLTINDFTAELIG